MISINECRQVAKTVNYKYQKNASKHTLIVGLYEFIGEIDESELPPRVIHWFNKATTYLQLLADHDDIIVL